LRRKIEIEASIAIDELEFSKSQLKSVAKKLRINNYEDWYNVKSSSAGIGNLLHKFGGSFYKVLSTLHPEHHWQAWRLERVPKEYWDKPVNQKDYFDWIGDSFGFKDLNHWYKVDIYQIRDKAPHFLPIVSRFENLFKTLNHLYANHKWYIQYNF